MSSTSTSRGTSRDRRRAAHRAGTRQDAHRLPARIDEALHLVVRAEEHQLRHEFLESGFRASLDLDPHGAVELIVDEDRMREEHRVLPARVALRAVDRELPVRQRALDGRGQLGAAFDAFRPNCDRSEGGGFRGPQDDDPTHDAVKRAALDVEPARGEAVCVRGMRKSSPERRLEGLALARRTAGIGD